jgi:hypothetical protein
MLANNRCDVVSDRVSFFFLARKPTKEEAQDVWCRKEFDGDS